MEIAEKENVLLTICVINERERERVSPGCLVLGGMVFAGLKGQRDG